MEKITLQFQCNQNVEEMAKGTDGRPFCTLCERSLHDFRGKPRKEVMAYTHEHEGCGLLTENTYTMIPFRFLRSLHLDDLQ